MLTVSEAVEKSETVGEADDEIDTVLDALGDDLADRVGLAETDPDEDAKELRVDEGEIEVVSDGRALALTVLVAESDAVCDDESNGDKDVVGEDVLRAVALVDAVGRLVVWTRAGAPPPAQLHAPRRVTA